MNEYEQALTMILKLEDTVAELLEALKITRSALLTKSNRNDWGIDDIQAAAYATEAINKAKGD